MKNFLPNTHNIHIVKARYKKPKEKNCKKCLSFSIIKLARSHKKISWCQYYGKEVDPKNEGCKKFS